MFRRVVADLFIRTRFGWTYMITGCGLGVAMAITGNGMRATGQFKFKDAGSSVSGTREFRTIIVQMMKLAFRYTWAFPLCLAVAATIAMMILRPGAGASPDRSSFQALLLGMVFDCGSQCVGGFFPMVGVGVGVVLMTRGVHVEPRKDEI
jgi:hypothetical protein